MYEIYARLTDILRDVFDDDAVIATPTLTAAEVPEWDSLAHVRLILAVQKAFGVKFSAAQVSTLKNVGDLADLIHSRRSAA